jgi:predicted nucleic acid-binding protein
VIAVDTSVLIDLFRGRETPAVAVLLEVETSGTPFRIPDVCCQELLQGARDEAEWRKLHRYLASQRRLDTGGTWQAHVEAARIYFDARRRGWTVRSTIDCLIAEAVLREGDVLLHDDDDFDAIAKVRKLRARRE